MSPVEEKIRADRGAAPESGGRDYPGALVRDRGEVLRVGLVNNMPDAALRQTERQFTEFLTAACPDLPIEVSLYSLPSVPRGLDARHYIDRAYRTTEHLRGDPPDAIIITGSEPMQQDLRDEPYWHVLTELVDWAKREQVPAMFSCLAAHAAVLHLDGIERRPTGAKCVGIFEEVVLTGGALVEEMAPSLLLPHSRWNEVTETALRQAGYEILTASPQAGVGFFAKPGDAVWLFCQGHPEYDGNSLLREYLRDIRRYMRHERATYPTLPQQYFDEADERQLRAFQKYALAHQDNFAMERFPADLQERMTRAAWKASAAPVVANWLRMARDQGVLHNLRLPVSDAIHAIMSGTRH